MQTPVFTVDRMIFASWADLTEAIAGPLGKGEIVQVMDNNWPANERLRYTIQWFEGAGRVFDGHGRQLGVFADLDALVAHAETVTA